MAEDEGVKATNDEATLSKRSAIRRGYWQDPYIQYFIRSGERKAPEINRGYFARVKGMQTLLVQFLELTKCQCQVVNLGAGFDTTYWNLKDQGLIAKNFIEVDFATVTSRKCYYVKSRKQLLEKLTSEDGEIKFNSTDLHSADYHVVGADMRKLDEFEKKLDECGIDRSLPTIFLAECVLVYMTSESSSALIRWIADKFPTVFFVNYEQVNMLDRFGEVMVENLKMRGCALAGVAHCASLQSQKDRFLTNGWEGVEALDMNQVYKNLPHGEVQSMDGFGVLVDLQMALFSHYCITWSYGDRLRLGLGAIGIAAPIESTQ